MDEAENKRKLQQERLERLRYVQMNRQDKLDSSKNIIMRAVRQEYPDIDRQEAEKVTRELVLAPKKSSIKIGNREVPVADLQFQIALTIEIARFGNVFGTGVFQLVYRIRGNHAAYERRFRVGRRSGGKKRVD